MTAWDKALLSSWNPTTSAEKVGYFGAVVIGATILVMLMGVVPLRLMRMSTLGVTPRRLARISKIIGFFISHMSWLIAFTLENFVQLAVDALSTRLSNHLDKCTATPTVSWLSAVLIALITVAILVLLKKHFGSWDLASHIIQTMRSNDTKVQRSISHLFETAQVNASNAFHPPRRAALLIAAPSLSAPSLHRWLGSSS
jgi:hypothetical protein